MSLLEKIQEISKAGYKIEFEQEENDTLSFKISKIKPPGFFQSCKIIFTDADYAVTKGFENQICFEIDKVITKF